MIRYDEHNRIIADVNDDVVSEIRDYLKDNPDMRLKSFVVDDDQIIITFRLDLSRIS